MWYFNLPYSSAKLSTFSPPQKNKNATQTLLSKPPSWTETQEKFCFSKTINFESLCYFSGNTIKNGPAIEGKWRYCEWAKAEKVVDAVRGSSRILLFVLHAVVLGVDLRARASAWWLQCGPPGLRWCFVTVWGTARRIASPGSSPDIWIVEFLLESTCLSVYRLIFAPLPLTIVNVASNIYIFEVRMKATFCEPS